MQIKWSSISLGADSPKPPCVHVRLFPLEPPVCSSSSDLSCGGDQRSGGKAEERRRMPRPVAISDVATSDFALCVYLHAMTHQQQCSPSSAIGSCCGGSCLLSGSNACGFLRLSERVCSDGGASGR
ncbi:hypothetical protein Efla_007298 [Eimeria flavescens]